MAAGTDNNDASLLRMGLDKKEIERGKRLFKTYGLTLVEYNHMLWQQGGVCYICRKPPKTRSLAVDHDHKFKYLKVVAENQGFLGWVATVRLGSKPYLGYGKTRNEAVRNVRALLKRASVRGLLCPHCNSGLRKYSDDPERFDRAAEYIRKFHERTGISKVDIGLHQEA